MKVFRENYHAGIGGLPEQGVFIGVVPGEQALLVSGKQHPRRKVAPNGDNVTLPCVWGREGVAVVFAKAGESGVRAGCKNVCSFH